MHSDNGFCPGRDPSFDVTRIQVVSAGTKVGEDRNALLVNDTNDRSDVGDRGRDDFIARSNASGSHGNVQRGGAGGARHHVFCRADLLEALNEGSRLRPLPVEQGVLLNRRLQPRTFRRTPTPSELRYGFHRFGPALDGEFFIL